MKEENKTLKLKYIDTSQYETWDHEQVLLWIISLDVGRYVKYKEVLQRNLKEEDVKGSHLKKVNVFHLKGWGIHNFDDKDLQFH